MLISPNRFMVLHDRRPGRFLSASRPALGQLPLPGASALRNQVTVLKNIATADRQIIPAILVGILLSRIICQGLPDLSLRKSRHLFWIHFGAKVRILFWNKIPSNRVPTGICTGTSVPNTGFARAEVLEEGNQDEARTNGVCGFSENGAGVPLEREKKGGWKERMMTKVRNL